MLRTRAQVRDVEELTRAYGREIFARMDDQRSVPFSPSWLDDRLMQVTMGEEPIKVQLFRFIDIGWATDCPERPAMPDKTLDTKGLACPLPILKTKKALSELPKGAKLEVLATDPGSVPDFTAFCESTGNVLLEQSQQGGVFRFVIEHRA